MPSQTRRQFLKNAAIAAFATSVCPARHIAAGTKSTGANDPQMTRPTLPFCSTGGIIPMRESAFMTTLSRDRLAEFQVFPFSLCGEIR